MPLHEGRSARQESSHVVRVVRLRDMQAGLGYRAGLGWVETGWSAHKPAASGMRQPEAAAGGAESAVGRVRAGVVIHVALVGVISPGDRRGPIDRERVKVDESELAAQRFVVRLVLEDVGLEDGICQGRVESVASRWEKPREWATQVVWKVSRAARPFSPHTARPPSS
eukprot:scaffold83173_cov76-Phaeocystis_antarctica.AAC.1